MNPDLKHKAKSRRVPMAEIAPEVLRRGGVISFVATGNSMWPHIRHGDTIWAKPLQDGQAPETGWVIVYLTPMGRLVVHRVVGRTGGDVFKVRGDASEGDAELVPQPSVLGRIVKRKRCGKEADLTSTVRELEGYLIARSGIVRFHLERWLRTIVRVFRGSR